MGKLPIDTDASYELTVFIRWKKKIGKPQADFRTAFTLNAHTHFFGEARMAPGGIVDPDADWDVEAAPDFSEVLRETEYDYGVKYKFIAQHKANQKGLKSSYFEVRPTISDQNDWDSGVYKLTKGEVYVYPHDYRAIFLESNGKKQVADFEVLRAKIGPD